MLAKYLILPRTVYILCLGTLVNRAGTFVIPFLTIYLQDALHWDKVSATRASGLYGVGALAAMVVGGQLADRYGRKIMMVCALGGAAASLTAFSMVSSTPTVLSLLLVFAFVGEMYRPAASAMIADVTPMAQRPQAFALMYVAVNLGFAIATPTGGLISAHSFQWLFWLDAATSAVYAVIIFVAIRETLHLARGVAANASPESVAAPREMAHDRTDGLIAAVRMILSDRVFVLYWFGTFFLCLLYMQAMTVLPLHLRQQGLLTRDYGVIIGVNGMLIVILQLPVTAVVTRFPRRAMVPLSSIVVGCGFAFTALAEYRWQHAAAVAIWTCGELMNAPLMSAIIGDLAPPRLRARYLGAFSMCFSLAMVVSPPLGGWVLETWGSTTLWMGCAGLGIISAFLYRVATRSMPS